MGIPPRSATKAEGAIDWKYVLQSDIKLDFYIILKFLRNGNCISQYISY